MTDEFLVRVTKITSSIGVSWTHSLPFCFYFCFCFLTQWIMAILSWCMYDLCKPDNFESRNSPKLSFTNIRGLRSNLFIVNLSLNQISWHSCSMWDKVGWLNRFRQFLCGSLSSFNPMGFYYSYAWSCSLLELISRKLSGFLLMFSTGFTSLSVLLLFPLSITFFVFNVHHKDWLTYSGGTDRPGELCYNFYNYNTLL